MLIPINFSNHDINKFILFLQRDVSPYVYMDHWDKFSESLLLEIEVYYKHLNMEEIPYADYSHGKRACKGFEKKIWGEYYELHVQSNTFLLADVFKNFQS